MSCLPAGNFCSEKPGDIQACRKHPGEYEEFVLSGARIHIKSLFARQIWVGFVTLLYVWWNPSFVPFVCGVLLLRKKSLRFKVSSFGGWVYATLFSLLIVLTAVALFNYAIDPLWCYSHHNRWNGQQIDFNERQQKTNLVTFRDFRYRTLLIGSSRVVCLNQNLFRGMDAFNYAVNSMRPEEYAPYVRYAREQNGREFENIIIGVDFFGTNALLKRDFDPPESYIRTANSFLYRYRMLLCYDVLKLSKETIEKKKRLMLGTYDRFNVLTPTLFTPAEQEFVYRYQYGIKQTEVGDNNYRYDEGLKEKLMQLRRDNPRTKFIVFTTPVSEPLFRLMSRSGQFPDYERWIRELVDVFGSIYNFMDINTMTLDYRNTFVDLHHVRAETGAMIAHRVAGIPDESIPDDFGALVTRQNVDEIIARLRMQRERYR